MCGQNNTPLRVAIYCRAGFSEYALRSQKERALSLISEHDDWKLVTTYTDFGTGPQISRRPGFKMMMADCRRGKFDKILVKSLSTLARDISDCMKVLQELSDLGVSVWFMDEGIDTGDNGQWMGFLSVYAAMSAIKFEDAAEAESTVPVFL